MDFLLISSQKKQSLLLIYICIFSFSVKVPLDIEMFKSLDTFIGPQLSSIATVIGEHCAVHALQNCQTTNSDQPKFVYFNRVNLAFKASVSYNI